MIPFTGLLACLYIPLQQLTQGIGSGITLYMVFLYISNFTVSVDNSTPIHFLFYPLGPDVTAVYNFTAYDEQFLQFGNHKLDLKQLDTNETGDSAHNSNFLFDYAVINDTKPFPHAKPSVAPNGTTNPLATAQSKKGDLGGAIAGGVIGGIIWIIVLAYLCRLVFFHPENLRRTDEVVMDHVVNRD
jgi:hypothetical protein